MLHLLDLSLFHMVNQWCGNWALDRIVVYEESNHLFKGGIILAAFWWFWFAASGPRQDAARRQVVATLIGVFVTLVLARAIAAAVPMRLRPMYMPNIGYHAPSLEMDMN